MQPVYVRGKVWSCAAVPLYGNITVKEQGLEPWTNFFGGDSLKRNIALHTAIMVFFTFISRLCFEHVHRNSSVASHIVHYPLLGSEFTYTRVNIYYFHFTHLKCPRSFNCGKHVCGPDQARTDKAFKTGQGRIVFWIWIKIFPPKWRHLNAHEGHWVGYLQMWW